jgi:hypothetical protein
MSSQAQSPPQGLKSFGSFHIGGRQAILNGYPITESVFTKGAAPTRVDPNGDFEVEQMYVQYFLPSYQKGKFPLLMWHGGGLTGVCWDTKPDGNPGWMQYFFNAGPIQYTFQMQWNGVAPLGLNILKFIKARLFSEPRKRLGRFFVLVPRIHMM